MPLYLKDKLVSGTGTPGKSAYEAAKEGGYVGTEEEFNQALTSVPGHITDTENPHSVTAAQVGADVAGAANEALNSAKAYTDQIVAGVIPGDGSKESPADSDSIFIYDNADSGKPKKTLISKLVELFNNTFYTKTESDTLLANKANASVTFLPDGTDFNSILENGSYKVYSETNSPSGVAAYMVTVIAGINGSLTQLAIAYNPENKRNRTFTRTRVFDSWEEWKELASIADLQKKPNPNLLDNWYFGNPVDQRGGYVVPSGTQIYADSAFTNTSPGVTEAWRNVEYVNSTYCIYRGTLGTGMYYIKTSDAVRGYTGTGYGIDRWVRYDGDTLLNDGYITLLGYGKNLDQKADKNVYKQLRGKTVTISVLGRGNFSIVSEDYTNNFKAKNVNSVEFTIVSLTLTVRSDADRFIFHIQPQEESSCDIVAAKLELGSHQTLAHQENGVWVPNEIPDYDEQLRRCQRYFWRSWTGERYNQNSILGVVFAGNRRITGFDYPVEMRTRPSITVYGLTGAGKVTDWTYDDDHGPVSPAYWDTQRCIALACDEAGLSDDDRVYYFIEANAELLD